MKNDVQEGKEVLLPLQLMGSAAAVKAAVLCCYRRHGQADARCVAVRAAWVRYKINAVRHARGNGGA